jgi:ubiquitin-protein ligase
MDKFLKDNPDYFTKNTKRIKSFVSDILSVLCYLDENNISHRDLKPDNILVFKGKGGDVDFKLGDTNCAKRIGLDFDSIHSFIKGTPCYMSPELFSIRFQSTIKTELFVNYRKSDVFSFGLMILDICLRAYQSLLLFTLLERNTLDATKTSINVLMDKLSKSCQMDDDLYSLLSKMLIINPQDRTGFTDLWTSWNIPLNARVDKNKISLIGELKSPNVYLKRVQRELRDLKLEKSVIYDYDDVTWIKGEDTLPIRISIYLHGPPDSLYEGGRFNIKICAPESYPIDPPKIYFLTPIYHPNIDDDGHVCLDILKDQWVPSFTFKALIWSLLSLLNDPQPNDALNFEAGKLWRSDKHAYEEKVKWYTKIYAKPVAK